MNNEVMLGTWAEIPCPYVTDIMSKAGFDFSIIDMEHGVVDFTIAQNMVFAAHGRGKQAFIRVPEIEESWTLKCLDMGCDGIIFPQVSKAEDVKKIIKCSYYQPKGDRGFNPFITAGGYTSVSSDFCEQENSRIKTGVILEGKDVFERIDDILRFPEIDIVYIGQYDLSLALGIPGDIYNSKVLDIMSMSVTKIRKSGKMAGCMVHSYNEAQKVMKEGFDFIVYKVDSGLLYQTINDFVKGVKNEII